MTSEKWYVVLSKNGKKSGVKGKENAEKFAKTVEGTVLGRIRREDLED